jgi:transposase
MLSMTVSNGAVTGGVDTHSQTHHAAVIDHLGRPLGDREFPATPGGYRALLRWMRAHGQLTQVGIEGTGTYGLGLLRHLQTADMVVVEVDRPSRRLRATRGKSDPIDAYAAAHTALTRTRGGTPKTRDGIVEAIRALRITRRSAVKARTQTINQLKALLVSAPTALREDLRHLRTPVLITACTALQVTGPLQDPGQAITLALHRLATRYQHLTNEITAADGELLHLVTAAAPDLIALVGVGVEVAGQLLTTMGDNPERMRCEAAFAHLCGVAPIPASSGKTHRHRLNRGGDRGANNALFTVALSRIRCDPRTRAYLDRRTAEGLTKPEIIRCLKRYLAREIYQVLVTPTRPRRPGPLNGGGGRVNPETPQARAAGLKRPPRPSTITADEDTTHARAVDRT